MMANMLCVLTLILASQTAAEEQKVTPVQKVLELLQGMKQKGIAEMKAEEVTFSAYSQWCDNQDRIKKKEIAEADEKIEKLNAEIAKATADIEALTARILELDEDIGRWNKDKTSASTIREKEKADFTATLQDYSESLDALERAINVLKKQSADRPQAELMQSLLQVNKLHLIPSSTKRVLTSFLQEDPESTYSAPEANAYEFQSGGVVDMLEKLLKQFKKQKLDLEEQELTAQHGYESIMQELTDNIENAEAEIARRSKVKAEREQDKADAEKDLAQTTADRDEDQKYLDDLTALCTQKRADFAKRQELRQGELDAIDKAIEIISSAAVAGSAEKHLPTLVQSNAVSLAQLRSSERNPVQDQVAAFLANRGEALKSKLLSMLAEKVADDPFKKVKKMIKDLVYKLMEEAREEAEHKGWCDTELTTNKQTRDKKSADVASLKAEIEELTAEIAKLTQDISDLQAAVKELDEAMAKATEDRTASKEKNQATIKDAKEAQEAVAQALSVLKDFYAKAGEATALTQQTPGEDAPASFDAPYKGMQSEGGGVIDFLEVIAADFARLESETTTDEETEQEEYETFMFESKKDKALKENEIGHKSEKKTAQEGALHSAKEELATTQEELDAALAYYEKLKPTCVDSGITYEERVKRREAEIISLKEALKILSGESVPTN
jgi:DNA repair exonuclease SbcCD ATPase subunit